MPKVKETKDENGKHHSFNDEPSIEYKNGVKYWHRNGKLHRDNDLPAVTWDHGEEHWFQHGERHRDNDLPAIIYRCGTMCWYKHGNFHRETDAAYIDTDGYKEYWLNGKQYTFHEWIKLTPISEEDKLVLLLEK
jgi:hypothetical protein